jgi:RNA polymerase sigma factor (sigma-70 family)
LAFVGEGVQVGGDPRATEPDPSSRLLPARDHPENRPSREDSAEIVSLFQSQYWPLVRLAVLLVDDVESAEDVVQEAYLSLYRRQRTLRDPTKTVDYLRSSVLNLSRSQLRRRIAARRRQRELERLELRKPAREQSAEQVILLDQRQRDLAAALRQLSSRQREVIVLRYYLDLSDSEIARTLDVSIGAVKQHMFRAIRSLRLVVEEER